jgi:hypothetical protein
MFLPEIALAAATADGAAFAVNAAAVANDWLQQPKLQGRFLGHSCKGSSSQE